MLCWNCGGGCTDNLCRTCGAVVPRSGLTDTAVLSRADSPELRAAEHDTAVLPLRTDTVVLPTGGRPPVPHVPGADPLGPGALPRQPEVGFGSSVPSGWYPDPYTAVALRYHDGVAWTAAVQPLHPPGGPAAAVMSWPIQRRKSPFLGFLLAFLFGGLALFYPSPRVAVVNLACWIIAGLFFPLVTVGAAVLAWPLWWVLVPVLTASRNRRTSR